MTIAQCFVLAAIVVTGIGAWTDWRTGHIPNWLTLGSLALAPVAHCIVALLTQQPPIEAVGYSLLSACMVGLVPLLLYRWGAIYGGDVKLMAAMGAILANLRLGVEAQLFAFVAGGAFAVGTLAYRGKLMGMLGNSLRLLTNPLVPKHKRREVTPEMMTELRFGPAIFAGMLGAAWMQWRPL